MRTKELSRYGGMHTLKKRKKKKRLDQCDIHGNINRPKKKRLRSVRIVDSFFVSCACVAHLHHSFGFSRNYLTIQICSYTTERSNKWTRRKKKNRLSARIYSRAMCARASNYWVSRDRALVTAASLFSRSSSVVYFGLIFLVPFDYCEICWLHVVFDWSLSYWFNL